MTNGQTRYNTALYLRLSKDDGTDSESSSIQTQKEMLTRYARDNGFVPFRIYCDDGWSGTTANRPDFQRMLSDVENGKINCVITKDLSRLGRNYLECGTFTEVFFPEHNCRYIAITDGVDTAKGSTMDITPFKNLLNDMYAQDISKKIKSSVLTRQKQGKFTGGKAPYGYKKSPDDKSRLVIDERYAPTVRRIYGMAESGLGITQIAKALSEEKILRPGAVAAETHANFEKYANDGKEFEWSVAMIRNILRNATYKGAVVGQKKPTISLKSKKRKGVGTAGTFVVEGMHEPIIEPERWEIIQRMITSRKKCDKGDCAKYNNIFSGLVKCADCGYALIPYRSGRTKKADPRENHDYYCRIHRENSKNCSKHRIAAIDLYNAVLADIQRLAKLAVKNDEKMISQIAARLGKAEKDGVRQAEREIKKARKRLAELDTMFVKTYEEHSKGKISDRNYNTLVAAYEKEQSELEMAVGEYEKTIGTSRANSENAANFVDLIKRYADIDELTQVLLNTLIDRIEVHEPEGIDGEFVQKIDVFYKFVGIID